MDAFVLTGGTGTLERKFTAPNPVTFNALQHQYPGHDDLHDDGGERHAIVRPHRPFGCRPGSLQALDSRGTAPYTKPGLRILPETFTLNTDAQGGRLFTAAMTAATGIAPEPPSLMLLGTGLLGLAGIVHRKFAARLRS